MPDVPRYGFKTTSSINGGRTPAPETLDERIERLRRLHQAALREARGYERLLNEALLEQAETTRYDGRVEAGLRRIR